MVGCAACHSGKQKSAIQATPHFDSLMDYAAAVFDYGDTARTFHFLDSIRHEYKNATEVDMFRYYNFIANTYSDKFRDYYNAASYSDSMMMIIVNNKLETAMPVEWAHVNYIKGDIQFAMGDYENAYDYYYRARVISKDIGDTCVIAYYTYRMAMVLYRQEKYKDAINNFKQSIYQYRSCSKDFVFFYRNQEQLDNIALSYSHLGMADSAIEYYGLALACIEQESPPFLPLKKHEWDEAKGVIYGNLGSVFASQKNYPLAEKWFKMSIAINDEKGHDIRDAQYSKIKLAEVYFAKGEYKEMLTTMQSVKAVLNDLRDIEAEMRWNRLMWRYYAAIKKPDSALAALSLFADLKDSITHNTEVLRSMDVTQRVNSRESEQQIDLLKKKNELKEAYLTLAGLTAFLSLIIVFLIYQNSRRSRKNVELLKKLNKQVQEQKQELENSNKEKDRILKAVAHDVRSPVNSVLGLTELILSNPEKISGEQHEFLMLIKEACANALELSKDILEAAATLKMQDIKKELVNIDQLLAQTIELIRPKSLEKNQKIMLQLPAEGLKLSLDKGKIARVIGNLLTNAIKFSPLGSDIKVKLEKNDNDVLISFRDTGIGIPYEIKDRIFDMFTEAKRPGTSGEKPYGLGLSISKHIIQAHGGKIWFESGYGNGTTFYVSLPLSP